MKFAIFGNTYQAKKSSHAVTLFKLLKKQGAEIGMCREFYQFLVSENMDIKADQLFDGDDFTADMVISIGGDGTFLKAARRVGRKGIPILGINTGRLGFLADISPEEMEETFDEIQNGRYSVEERSVLQLICTLSQIPNNSISDSNISTRVISKVHCKGFSITSFNFCTVCFQVINFHFNSTLFCR